MSAAPPSLGSWRLWIKAIPFPRASEAEAANGVADVAVAYRLEGPLDHAEAPDAERMAGSYLRGLVVTVAHVVRDMPTGSALHITTDDASFWGAYNPADRWIDRWAEQDFRKKPDHHKSEWRHLHRACAERNLTISAGPPGDADIDPQGWPKLEEVKSKAHALAYPDAHQPEDDPWDRGDESGQDWLRDALAKDP